MAANTAGDLALRVRLVTDVIDPAEVNRDVDRPEAGAIALFLGCVRNHDAGQAVTRLEYEAYERIAAPELVRIAQEIEANTPEARVAVRHRLGSLVVGDIALACAVSAPHRGEAFAAVRRIVDEIKSRVPIWKRQWGPDGPHWVGWTDARCSHPSPDHVHAHGPAAHALAAEQKHHSHSHPSGHASTPLRVATLTVSDSRTAATDVSGNVLREELARGAFGLGSHRVVPDEVEAIRASVLELLAEADAVVLTGGTGITPRDVTIEAISPLLEKQLSGFGEAFRTLSWEEVGERAILSRALAGTRAGKLIAALPGSPAAARLGARRLLVPLLPHAVAMLKS
jgi:molybdenum cofactor synthesis domain-containing protein